MYDSVLLPTDGSAVSEQAAVHGIALSRRLNATAHVLSVVDPGFSDRIPVGSGTLSAQREAANTAIQRLTSIASAVGVESTGVLLDGSPGATIVEYAGEESIDCVVLGTRGRGAVIRYLLGSVAMQVVWEAPCPVMTVSGDGDVSPAPDSVQAVSYDTIVVATDGSDHAQNAVEEAVALAESFDATLHALFVVNELAYTTHPPPNRSWETYKQRLEREGRAVLDQVRRQAARSDVAMDSAIEVGVPEPVIQEYVDDVDADCLVMGTRGRSGLQRAALGSVTEHTIRSASIPVLTLGSEDE